MLVIEMDPYEPFSDAVQLMHRFDYFACFQCNPNMFSILIPHSSPPSIITLTMSPQFFTRFSCDQTHYVHFSIDDFFSQILHHTRLGYHSLTLCLAEFRFHMALEFHSPSTESPFSPQLLPTWQPVHYELTGKIDYGSFVSLDLREFQHLVLIFNNTETHVLFVVTNSELKFFLPDREVVFTTQMDQCIIGGIKEGEEFSGAIGLNPREAYFNFPSERIWLFKCNDPSGVTLVAPLGLYVNISTYFPQLLV